MKATNPYSSKINITVLKTNKCSGKSLLERNEELAARNRAVAEQCQQKLEVAFFQYFVVDFSKGNTWPLCILSWRWWWFLATDFSDSVDFVILICVFSWDLSFHSPKSWFACFPFHVFIQRRNCCRFDISEMRVVYFSFEQRCCWTVSNDHRQQKKIFRRFHFFFQSA